jgi:sphingomyelin phosphodiesterase acid-like 3
MHIFHVTLVSAYFWQINDIHYDSYYWSSQASCNEAISQPGQYGDYRCDAPWSLVESSVKALKQHGPSPEFIW